MDIDGDELGGFLGSGSYMPSDLASHSHSVSEDVASGNRLGGMQGNRGGAAFGQSDDSHHGADMDAMVAERRSSLANGFGLDYLTMGDPDDSYTAMVSPTYSTGRMSRASASLGVPTTLDDVIDMSAPVPPGMMMGYGTMSSPEMQPSMTLYTTTRTGSLTPRASHPSSVDSMMPSVPTSPAMGIVHRPSSSSQQRTLSVSTVSSDMTIQSHAQSSSLDQSMVDRSSRSSIHGMCCSRGFAYDIVTYGYPDVVPSSEQPLTLHSKQAHPQMPQPTIFAENTYPSTGFDMLDILVTIFPLPPSPLPPLSLVFAFADNMQNRVANRENPQINIGAVDMSCAFVVTDIRKFDNPIIYCSATFERLTGYTKHEVLGRNCRFLQAPDGNIKRGDRRKYVDENAVYYLKNQINSRQEAQTSLINYRKGGQSFTNLLTMIPIQDDSDDVVYFVGFQVDLVDQPGAMMNRNRGIKSNPAPNQICSDLRG